MRLDRLEQEGFRLLGLRGGYPDDAPGPRDQRIVYIDRSCLL